MVADSGRRRGAGGEGWPGVWRGREAGRGSAAIGVVNGWARQGCSIPRPGCGQRLRWSWVGCRGARRGVSGGIWVGVKGELSLASPPPEGAGWPEIAWAGFLGGLARKGGAGWGWAAWGGGIVETAGRWYTIRVRRSSEGGGLGGGRASAGRRGRCGGRGGEASGVRGQAAARFVARGGGGAACGAVGLAGGAGAMGGAEGRARLGAEHGMSRTWGGAG